ncbi:MAG: binding-protein-dependent transport system inner rane component [Paenibacillaceae bacterium]|jgi:putative aldouronate transport system permease protein|nr:binding-protein-dependent transport system inner rane component [Paenibacillaceae bacterium]
MTTRRGWLYQLPIHLFFIVISAAFIIPLWSIVAISLTNESDIATFGYKLIPGNIDFQAYRFILKNPMSLINAYKVTIVISVIGTLLSVLMVSMCACALARPNFKYARVITMLLFFTMLFNGGLVPSYILMTKYLHLQNTYFALIIPLLGSVWHMLLMRTFFKQLPESLVESATLEGAGELRIYLTIIVPLSTPVLATVSLMQLLACWNSWYPALLYISDSQLYPLQYLLQVMMQNIQEILKNMRNDVPVDLAQLGQLPTENARMAMCVLAIGPMLFIFPFFQKYFAKGMTVGSVKG